MIHTVTAETFSLWSDRVLTDSDDEGEIAFSECIVSKLFFFNFMTEKEMENVRGFKKFPVS